MVFKKLPLGYILGPQTFHLIHLPDCYCSYQTDAQIWKFIINVNNPELADDLL